MQHGNGMVLFAPGLVQEARGTNDPQTHARRSPKNSTNQGHSWPRAPYASQT